MPFVSQKQRAYLFAKKPEIAKEFAKETPKGKKLPIKLKKSGKKLIPGDGIKKIISGGF